MTKRKAMTARKQQLWQDIFGAHRRHEARYGLFDHALLGEFIRRLDGARPALVVHGGSSIARSDLECLSGTGVARVNFGTEVFRDYLLAMAEELPGQRPAAMADHAERGLEPPVYGPRQVGRPNKLAPYLDYLRERLAAYPDLSSVRLTREIRELGYRGALCRATASST